MLPENLDASRPLIVRVSTPFALQFRATLLTMDAFRKSGSTFLLIVGLFAGILTAMILYNLGLYLFTHDRHYLYYILYIFFMLVWQCLLTGLLRYFWPPLGDMLISYVAAFSILMMVFAAIFAVVFLDTARTAPRHDVLLKGLMGFMALALVLTLLKQLWIVSRNSTMPTVIPKETRCWRRWATC